MNSSTSGWLVLTRKMTTLTIKSISLAEAGTSPHQTILDHPLLLSSHKKSPFELPPTRSHCCIDLRGGRYKDTGKLAADKVPA
jgi:hypothetical protein